MTNDELKKKIMDIVLNVAWGRVSWKHLSF